MHPPNERTRPPCLGSALVERLECLRLHDHLCVIYETREEKLEALVPYLSRGLERNERCLYVADSGAADDIGAELRGGGVDVEGAIGRGAFTLASERETYLAKGEFDPDGMLDLAVGAARQAVTDGFGGLRIAGEMSWALGDDAKIQRLLEYEAKVNARILDAPALAVCQYDRRRFSPEVIREVIRTHPFVVMGGRVCRNFYYVPPGELAGPDRLHRDVERLLENILERERAEDALRESERRLAMASRLATAGTLAAGVAHEINNPLAYVAANLRFLAEQLRSGGSDELRRATAEALDGAERIRDVVQRLRRFAGPGQEAGRAPVDVAAEIEAAVGIVRHQLASRARLVVDLAADLPPVVVGPHEFGQVVVNLLVNAAQAIPEGRSAENEVRVSARAAEGRVLLRVSDTGCGIPPDVVERIFDPFFTTKQAGGTGLGLAICHGIVSAAGGTIRAESTPGKGTTVSVDLPAGKGTPGATDDAPRTGATRRLRVIVVDDEPLVGRALARLLSAEHDVEVLVSAGELARRAEGGERWDVVLCDLIMPEMTGMELSERLGRVAPELAGRMVFVTGGAYTEASRTFLAEPGRRYIEKPVDASELREIVRAVGRGLP